MASVFLAAQRALRPPVVGRAVRTCRATWTARPLHTTPVVLKKKNSVSEDRDDLFGEDGEDSDALFSSSPDPPASKKPSPSATTSTATSRPTEIPPHNLSVPASATFDQSARFEEMYAYLHACIVTKSEKARQPRRSIWGHLLSLVETSEDLERVTELFPKWRDARKTFTTSFATAFARRTSQLRCPELALKVFGDHSKYGLDLNLTAARVILRKLSYTRPLEESVALTALYSVYLLPPVASDVFSTAYLLNACLLHAKREDTPAAQAQHALAVARALLPPFEALLEKTPAKDLALDDEIVARDVPRDQVGLALSLKHVSKQLKEREIEHAWLDKWIKESGLAVYLAQAAS